MSFRKQRLQPLNLHLGLLPFLVIHIAVGTVMRVNGEEFEVNSPIVGAAAVLVVNNLLTPERSTQILRDHETMFEDGALLIDHRVEQMQVLWRDGATTQHHVTVVVDRPLNAGALFTRRPTGAWPAATGPLLSPNLHPNITRRFPSLGAAVNTADEHLNDSRPTPLTVSKLIGHAGTAERLVWASFTQRRPMLVAEALEFAVANRVGDLGGGSRPRFTACDAGQINHATAARINILLRPIHQGVSNARLPQQS